MIDLVEQLRSEINQLLEACSKTQGHAGPGMDWSGLLSGFCLPIVIAMVKKANEIDRPSPCHECG